MKILMDLYQKVERVIRDHIIEHQTEVHKGNELLKKLDMIRHSTPSEDYSYDLTATGERFDKKSTYYYDYDRHDLSRPNPFEIPDYTEL